MATFTTDAGKTVNYTLTPGSSLAITPSSGGQFGYGAMVQLMDALCAYLRGADPARRDNATWLYSISASAITIADVYPTSAEITRLSRHVIKILSRTDGII